MQREILTLTLLEKKDQNLELMSKITDVSEQQAQLRLQADQIKVDSNKNISQMRNRLLKAELQLQYQNVVAPADGVVFDPKVRREGVQAAGETLLTLVPQSGLYAEVLVSTRILALSNQAKMQHPSRCISIYAVW